MMDADDILNIVTFLGDEMTDEQAQRLMDSNEHKALATMRPEIAKAFAAAEALQAILGSLSEDQKTIVSETLASELGKWIKLTDRMPNPEEHERVLIYTEGYDFNGEQVFDVRAETLNECFYADPEDQPEVCKHASHWAAHPRDAALPLMNMSWQSTDAIVSALQTEQNASSA